MMHIKHSHSGAVPSELAEFTRRGTQLGLLDAVGYFHSDLRDRRFTKAHASAAGYWTRKPGYMKRKRREMGHDRPLEWKGTTRDLIESQFRLESDETTGRAIYPGARGFNRRHPSSPIKMREEFEIILPEEEEQFAEKIDVRLAIELAGA